MFSVYNFFFPIKKEVIGVYTFPPQKKNTFLIYHINNILVFDIRFMIIVFYYLVQDTN